MRTNWKKIFAIFVIGITGAISTFGAVFMILEHDNLNAGNSPIHFDLPTLAPRGNSFLQFGTPMVAVGIASVLLIVGIMAIATSLNSKPELELTRPEHLKTKFWPEQPEIGDTDHIQSTEQPPPTQPIPKPVVCRYCGQEIVRGRYCVDCHLSTG